MVCKSRTRWITYMYNEEFWTNFFWKDLYRRWMLQYARTACIHVLTWHHAELRGFVPTPHVTPCWVEGCCSHSRLWWTRPTSPGWCMMLGPGTCAVHWSACPQCVGQLTSSSINCWTSPRLGIGSFQWVTNSICNQKEWLFRSIAIVHHFIMLLQLHVCICCLLLEPLFTWASVPPNWA